MLTPANLNSRQSFVQTPRRFALSIQLLQSKSEEGPVGRHPVSVSADAQLFDAQSEIVLRIGLHQAFSQCPGFKWLEALGIGNALRRRRRNALRPSGRDANAASARRAQRQETGF